MMKRIRPVAFSLRWLPPVLFSCGTPARHDMVRISLPFLPCRGTADSGVPVGNAASPLYTKKIERI